MFNTEPLMFIETAATKSAPSGQTIYDSRYDKKVLVEEVKEELTPIDEETLSKLESVVDLYQMSKPVLCDIKTLDENIEGIPLEINNEYLFVRHQGDTISLNLNTIKEIIIKRV